MKLYYIITWDSLSIITTHTEYKSLYCNSRLTKIQIFLLLRHMCTEKCCNNYNSCNDNYYSTCSSYTSEFTRERRCHRGILKFKWKLLEKFLQNIHNVFSPLFSQAIKIFFLTQLKKKVIWQFSYLQCNNCQRIAERECCECSITHFNCFTYSVNCKNLIIQT